MNFFSDSADAVAVDSGKACEARLGRLAAGLGIARDGGLRTALDPVAAVDTAGGRGRRVLDGARQLEDDRVVEPDLVRGDGALHLAAVVELNGGVRRVDHALEAGGVVEQDVALASVIGGWGRIDRRRAPGWPRPVRVVGRTV